MEREGKRIRRTLRSPTPPDVLVLPTGHEDEHGPHGLRAPFLCIDQLLFDVDGFAAVLGTPLLLIQFMDAVADPASCWTRASHPSRCSSSESAGEPAVSPVWSRELLYARKPPKPTFQLREFNDIAAAPPAIWSCAPSLSAPATSPPHLHGRMTSFDVLAAFVWRARPRALEIPAGEDEQADVGERVEHGEAATGVRCGEGGPPAATSAEEAARTTGVAAVAEQAITGRREKGGRKR
uniref:Uncharacterized protein n=1 Tax=Oryza glumipatula TaxID=40148 RepID=A0A0E0BQ93_9ORYZ